MKIFITIALAALLLTIALSANVADGKWMQTEYNHTQDGQVIDYK